VVDYVHVFAFILLLLSPVWPLGENPLPNDPYIIINKQSNELAYIQNKGIKQIIKVATGKTVNLTPEGEFTVTVKAVNPYYRRSNIEGGAPQNPLGVRWIGFDARETDGRIYGIHGTNQPGSIGKHVSNGCIRVENREVSHLYDQVPLGTKVWIVSTDQSFEELAAQKGIVNIQQKTGD